MATNMTQKDRTLNDLITWLERQCDTLDADISDARDDGYSMDCYDLLTERDAYQNVIDHCREMLGYSGNMPNHSEGVEQC